MRLPSDRELRQGTVATREANNESVRHSRGRITNI